MKSLLEEIRNQPQHIREVFMWLCVVITFSMVSFFWFQSTAKEFVAIVNPEQARADRALVQKNSSDQPSVLATISQSASTLKASVLEILGLNKDNTVEFTGSFYRSDPVPPSLFPASKDK